MTRTVTPAVPGRRVAPDRDRDSRRNDLDRAQSLITRRLRFHAHSPALPLLDPVFPIRATTFAFHRAAPGSRHRLPTTSYPPRMQARSTAGCYGRADSVTLFVLLPR